MSVLLTYQNITKDKAWVDGRVYQIEKQGKLYPIDELSAQEKSMLDGHIIQDESAIPPAPPEEKGKTNLLMLDLNTEKLFWETTARPLTSEEIQQELLEKFDLLLVKQDEIIRFLSSKELEK